MAKRREKVESPSSVRTIRQAEARRNNLIRRGASYQLDKMLGSPIPVLDTGFVRVVDYMGNDSSIVQAARVSYGEGTKHVQTDRGLIRYLMRHAHTTPFEMCEIKLHVRAPMDVWRQWIRHRTASVNEYSTRYSLAIDAAQVTPKNQWRGQATSNRQGSDGRLPVSLGAKLSAEERKLQKLARSTYERRIAVGVAREQARKDLPLSTYTESYWKIDLHNLLHFLALRMDEHAQSEIRAYATAIGREVVSKWVPITWEAFNDFERESLKLSRIETQILRALIGRDTGQAMSIAAGAGLLKTGPGNELKANRERAELENKAARLGISQFPWTA